MYKGCKIVFVLIGWLMLSLSMHAASGKCGDNVRWNLNEQTGVLTISGSGPMWNWKTLESPWYKNSSIKNVVINSGVTTVGNFAFQICNSLTSITIPNSVTSIGERAFAGCENLSSITIPNSVTSISNAAFSSCFSLTSITIPNSVTSIGESAFIWCKNVTSIRIGNSVSGIGKSAFRYCKKLTSITIPNGVKSIEQYTFGDCESLKSITIPNSVTRIAECSFTDCHSLTSITIPNSVTRIGYLAFSRCRSLTSITIPNGVTSIGFGVFSGCESLKSIIVAENNTKYDSRNHCNAIIETATNALIAGCKNTVIPKNVKAVGERAFSGCKEMTSITIPNSVTWIGENAFNYCKGLTSVIIPYSVTGIEKGAFSSCDSLKSIIVAENNTKYDSRNHCNAIIETATNALIAGCKNTVIPKNVTSIGEKAFYGCESLKSITIPNGVKSIGKYAFEYCKGLTSVMISNSVTNIEYGAFEECHSLTSITIPNSVTSIGDYAFAWCKSLTSVVIGNGITSLGKSAFAWCDDLKELYYPQGLDISQAGINSKTKLIEYDPSYPPNVKPAQPPILSFIEGSLAFDDTSKNNRIDANENSKIKFKIKNNGKGPALNCEVRVKLSGTKSGISVQNVKLPSIAAGQTYDISVPVTSNVNTQDGNVTISIEVYEPNGFGISSRDVNIATKAFIPPYIQVVNYNVSSPSGEIRRMEAFTLAVTLQNVKYGDAEDVKVKIVLPTNIFLIEGKTESSYPLIKAGEKEHIELNLLANNNYIEQNIPIAIDIKEKYGKYAENKQLNIELVQPASPTTNIIVKEEKETFRIVSSKDMALVISGTPRISILTNTSVSIMRPEWYNKYHNPQNIKAPFPYAVIQLELKGNKEAIDLAKQRLSLTLGGKHIVAEKDTKDTNTIWFLVHCRNEYIDLDCGDGCEPINIWKERLEPNKVYCGAVTISVQ